MASSQDWKVRAMRSRRRVRTRGVHRLLGLFPSALSIFDVMVSDARGSELDANYYSVDATSGKVAGLVD